MSYRANGRAPRPRTSNPAGRGEITAILEQVVSDWPRQPAYPDRFRTRALQYAPYPVPKACTMTPRQLAGQLMASDRFRALKLGRRLRRPDAPGMRAAVEDLSPLPLREDIELLIAALTLAAENQQERRQATAVLVWLLLSTAVCLIVLAYRA